MPYIDNRNDCPHAYILYQDDQVVQFWDAPSIESVVTAQEFASSITVIDENGQEVSIPRFVYVDDAGPVPDEVTERRAALAALAAANGGHL